MDYSVELKPDAIASLERITQVIQKRIVSKIRWLTENFDQVSPEPLTGNLKGLFKLRVGDYRVVYSFNREEKLITIHLVGHRREIYD